MKKIITSGFISNVLGFFVDLFFGMALSIGSINSWDNCFTSKREGDLSDMCPKNG